MSGKLLKRLTKKNINMISAIANISNCIFLAKLHCYIFIISVNATCIFSPKLHCFIFFHFYKWILLKMHRGILYTQVNRKINKSMTFDSSNYVSILIKTKLLITFLSLFWNWFLINLYPEMFGQVIHLPLILDLPIKTLL